ncbi:hypothetical protein TEA_015463 [Camellia sinensis var. sinensis]|uniref:Uncharacterized protein n=1 Tax=Camellia sinensis var. sinensis TaxID=542762 RepID=A0A4S4E5C6_CAMSN|nr:hypothetical protein TEA_015463 [Camellia sinensis var. sinensis]
MGLLGTVGRGGSGSSGGSTNGGSMSTVSMDDSLVLTFEESSSYPHPDESELQLGLGLSLGGGGGALKSKSSSLTLNPTPRWGQYARILTAQDFPSMMPSNPSSSSSNSPSPSPSLSSSSSSSSSMTKANFSAGTKRSADSVAPSPPNGGVSTGKEEHWCWFVPYEEDGDGKSRSDQQKMKKTSAKKTNVTNSCCYPTPRSRPAVPPVSCRSFTYLPPIIHIQAQRRDQLDFDHFGEDPSIGVDIIAISVPSTNIPSTESSTSMPSLHLTPRHAHQFDHFDVEHFGKGPSMGLSPHVPFTVMSTPQTSPPQRTHYISQPSPELYPLMSNILSHIMTIYWTPPGHHPHIGQSYHADPLITQDFHIEGKGEGQVYAPTRRPGHGSRRGRAIDPDRSALDEGVSQLSAVSQALSDVVSNISTVPIGDGQPPSPRRKGVVRVAAQDIRRVYSKRPRRGPWKELWNWGN